MVGGSAESLPPEHPAAMRQATTKRVMESPEEFMRVFLLRVYMLFGICEREKWARHIVALYQECAPSKAASKIVGGVIAVGADGETEASLGHLSHLADLRHSIAHLQGCGGAVGDCRFC